MNIKTILYYAGLLALIIISYFLYSPRYYAFLNSDDALNVLMTYYYKLPRDLYCWGQDRGGTLIPLLGQIFYKGLGMSPINSVSVTNYLILILGYIGFSSLFKNRFSKLLFAVVWFFPPFRLIDLIRFPLGIEYSLIGFSILIINTIDFKNRKIWINYSLIFVLFLLLSAAVWVSDLAMVSIAILGITLLLFYYLKNRNFRIRKDIVIITIAGIAANFLFIRYAKSTATIIYENYLKFNSLNDFMMGIGILKTELFEIFTFRCGEPFLSIYAWLVTFCIVLCIWAIINKSIQIPENQYKWIAFFALDFLAVFGIILLSKWVFENGIGRWYFVPSYISLSMLILLLFDNFSMKSHKIRFVKILLFATVLIGAVSTIHFLKFVKPKTLRPEVEVRAELLELGEIGIIAGFWNSYISACPDPSKIKATPHDKDFIRNRDLVDEVFAQPALYVIKDRWLETFPDTLCQFGYVLKKAGEPFRLAKSDLCKYEKIGEK